MKHHLLLFCATDERHSICSPWSAGLYSYATNGRILVREPRYEDIPERDDAPKKIEESILLLPSGMTDQDEHWDELATFDTPSELKCEPCRGRGQHECSCGDWHECNKCKGVGTVASKAHAEISGVLILLVDLSKICILPGIQVQKQKPEPHAPLQFRYWAHENVRGRGAVAQLTKT